MTTNPIEAMRGEELKMLEALWCGQVWWSFIIQDSCASHTTIARSIVLFRMVSFSFCNWNPFHADIHWRDLINGPFSAFHILSAGWLIIIGCKKEPIICVNNILECSYISDKMLSCCSICWQVKFYAQSLTGWSFINVCVRYLEGRRCLGHVSCFRKPHAETIRYSWAWDSGTRNSVTNVLTR